jgi:hypothetical protein
VFGTMWDRHKTDQRKASDLTDTAETDHHPWFKKLRCTHYTLSTGKAEANSNKVPKNLCQVMPLPAWNTVAYKFFVSSGLGI